MGVIGCWTVGQQKCQAMGTLGALCSGCIRQWGALINGGLGSGSVMQQRRWAERESQAGVLGSRSVGQQECRAAAVLGSGSVGQQKHWGQQAAGAWGQQERGGSGSVGAAGAWGQRER